ncbi:MAG: glycosyltransferase [Euryarchaeota archaeon]|nr:glycosyltransferase [Euryarchaeota archaeon]MBU4547459.1 glycosyltransferase [Euryarchaeota archaeon]MBV1754224.1 glycosyltransferase [Methanobacterium sp.]MBV1767125.1 glycosyltransferase [Methanobacterium sp.]
MIDNGSKDNSLEMIRKYAKKEIIPTSEFYNHIPNKEPINIIEYTREEMDATLDNDKESEIKDIDSNKKMVLIKSEKNYGFPEGCNIGMRYALKKGIKHFLLLNNDTVMDKKFLTELMNISTSDDQIGIVGSKILYYYHPDVIQARSFLDKQLLGEVLVSIYEDCSYPHGLSS